jgi:23S rRNA (uracil1939-C5)-methyltransferase
MLQLGQTVTVLIEKPAAGGRMIARVDGQVVLVAGTIPGERVAARIDRLGKGVAYASTVTVEEPSPDRRAVRGDSQCGGGVYTHIEYDRQRALKSVLVADAFARIGRLSLPAEVAVAPSPVEGYRMRARLHCRGGLLGFFREGTHDLCGVRQTGQLLPSTCDAIDRLGGELAKLAAGEVEEIEIAENLDASERVVHIRTAPTSGSAWREAPFSIEGVTGLTISTPRGGTRVLSGSPFVTDRFEVGAADAIAVRRHVLAFFQGNRFLLRGLVAHVVERVPVGAAVIDLYAGGGLFAVAAARARQARVTAVEGDRAGAADLAANAASAGGGVHAVHQSVELFVTSAAPDTDVVIVDPPRTGLSREALDGVVRLRPRRVIYVSCDIATLARDARRIVDAGYDLTGADAFDLFPNTPHVECVVVFDSASSNTSRTR